ncbi:MAG: aspartate/glutamate racemase family protein [Nannocystaceae bacterium]
MIWQPRDPGINRITARDKACYGMGLGVMLLDESYPGFPGDVRNASAYPFPIQYEVIEGVDMPRLIYAKDKTPCLEPIKRAAKKLEKMGCRAITAECGYFAYFQQEIASHVDIPVFLSALLQVPLAQQVIGPKKVVGIISHAELSTLEAKHLESVGIRPGSNYVTYACREVEGACEEFEHLWTPGKKTDPPTAYYQKTEREFVETAAGFFRRTPNMGAMLLECTGMQTFARALQREIEIPIFSWGTLLDYAYSLVVHRDYYGHV